MDFEITALGHLIPKSKGSLKSHSLECIGLRGSFENLKRIYNFGCSLETVEIAGWNGGSVEYLYSVAPHNYPLALRFESVRSLTFYVIEEGRSCSAVKPRSELRQVGVPRNMDAVH